MRISILAIVWCLVLLEIVVAAVIRPFRGRFTHSFGPNRYRFKGARCSEIRMCRKSCPYGFVRGESGCPVCQCRPPRNCRQAICQMHCQHGFKTGSDGCPICECYEPTASQLPAPMSTSNCPAVLCRNHCEFGRKKDTNGCDTCECLPDSTRSPRLCQAICRVHCPYGYRKGPDGCAICVCNERPVQSRCPYASRRRSCPSITCQMFCPDGFKKDSNGCSICECEEDSSSTARRAERRRRRSPDDEGEAAEGDVVDSVVLGSRRNICALPAEGGPCRAHIRRWHFDTSANQCRTFIYGGCRGNENNFGSLQSCTSYCTAQEDVSKKQRKSRNFGVLGIRV